ncbi:MAG: hypothetical protein M3282_07710 [Gemmatimonadota bacterium]|nr:hypothetical protein [Gemmatimonadota bacterium]
MLLWLLLLAACEAPAAPVLADGAQRFQPPPAYQLWWEMTLQCSGRRAPLSGVRWYFVPGARTVEVNGERYAGYWSSAGNSIVLAEEAMLDGSLVRHEMLHSLIDVGSHPREEFLGRCGGVVECEVRCIADAEPSQPVDPAIARAGTEALEIETVVRPQAPSRTQYGGYFTMTVTARNPGSHPVVVTLPPSGDAGPPVTFGYRVEYQSGYAESNERAWDDGVMRFAPGETKRHVFDFHIVGAEQSTLDAGLRPGTYDLRGAYGGRWAPATTITLSPP